MILTGLNGYAQTGKDTVASILTEQYGFERRAFADKLREALYALDPLVGCCNCGAEHCPAGARYSHLIDDLGYEDARKTECGDEIRRSLQRLGTEVGRELLGADVWVEAAVRDLGSITVVNGGGEVVRRAMDVGDAYVFTDCRFPNEALKIKQLGGTVWRVERPGYGPVNDHPSETALDDWPFDARIVNNADLGTLARRVRVAVETTTQGVTA